MADCDQLRAQMNAILATLQGLNQSLADANSARNLDYITATSADTFVPGVVPDFPPEAADIQARIMAIQQWGAQHPGNEAQVNALVTAYGKVLTDLQTIATLNENIALQESLLSNVVQQILAEC